MPIDECRIKVCKKRCKMLVESGVIVEHPDGSREAVSPEKARKHLVAMDSATRSLYEDN